MKRSLFTLGIRRRAKAREEMREELAFHVEERAARLAASGMAPEAARAEAIRLLGSDLDDAAETLGESAEHKERTLDMRDWMHDFADDMRYAMRGLARRPGFTAIAVITLALGIGANTAIYSAVDALLLRSLPFREPDRLMDIALVSPQEGHTRWSYPKAEFFREAQRSFSSIALYSELQGNLSGENPERVTIEHVSASFLGTLGVDVGLGRDFDASLDAGPRTGVVAIISDALWQRRFGADPNVIGRSLEIDNTPYEVVAVLPPTFRGMSGRADALITINSRGPGALGQAWSLEFAMLGRLKPDEPPASGIAETRRLGPQVYAATPVEPGTLLSAGSTDWTADARPLNDIRVASVLKRSLLVLFGAVAMVLLIACVNLANLLLARATARRREIAVRLAIGATRGRLIRLLLAESLLLAAAGGVAGLAVARWAISALRVMNPLDALRAQSLGGGIGAVGFDGIRLDGSALLFTFAATLGVGLLFGIVPAIGGTRADLTGGLKDDGTGAPPGRGGLGVSRRALVIAEVSLAIVLLAGSGLMVKSLVNLMNVDTGFRANDALTLRFSVPVGNVVADSLPGFYDRVQDAIGGLPGVGAVSFVDCPPVSGGCNGTIMTFADRPPSPTGNAIVGVHWVSANWLETMRVPLKRGRMFDGGDRLGTQKVVILNEAAVRKYFPGDDPLGKTVAIYQGGFHSGAQVIGVVGDIRFGTIDSIPRPDAYISYAQSARGRAMMFVRADGDPAAIAPSVLAKVKEVAPTSPVYDVQPWRSRMATATGQARLSAALLGSFAMLALALAVMGIYGVMSFAVTQRAREVGIRVALGADRSAVLRLFTREGLALSATGVAIGLVGAVALTRVLRTLLFNVAPDDPATIAMIVAIVLAAATVATWIPARRATDVDPVQVLR